MNPSTVYRGGRHLGPDGVVLGVQVEVVAGGRAHPLRPDRSLRVRSHSPCGFEWGYGGSGPAQLALALCLDVLGDRRRALAVYQWVKWATVAHWGDRWEVTAAEVLRWVEQAEREESVRLTTAEVAGVLRGLPADDAVQMAAFMLMRDYHRGALLAIRGAGGDPATCRDAVDHLRRLLLARLRELAQAAAELPHPVREGGAP